MVERVGDRGGRDARQSAELADADFHLPTPF